MLTFPTTALYFPYQYEFMFYPSRTKEAKTQDNLAEFTETC